jgi:hypothetical protein
MCHVMPQASGLWSQKEATAPLSRLFGNSAEFWLNAQRAVDLWDAVQAIKEDVAQITPLQVASRPLVAAWAIGPRRDSMTRQLGRGA